MHTCKFVHRHIHRYAPHVTWNWYVMQCVFWHAYFVFTWSFTTSSHCLASPFDQNGVIAASRELRKWLSYWFVCTSQRSHFNFSHKVPCHNCASKNVSKHFGLMIQNVLNIMSAFSWVQGLPRTVTNSTTGLPISCMTIKCHQQNKMKTIFRNWHNGRSYVNQLLHPIHLKL